MRIYSVTGVNTRQRNNPHSILKAGSVTTGRSASQISFEDCLKSQIQDLKALATTYGAEGQAAGFLLGSYIPKEASHRPELKHRARA